MSQRQKHEAVMAAKTFIDKTKGIHRVFQSQKSHYDQQVQEYVPSPQRDPLAVMGDQEYEHQIQQYAKQCEEKMQTFLEKHSHREASDEPGNVNGALTAPSTQATWEEVLVEVDRAREKWESKAKGWTGFFRGQFRAAEEGAKFANPFLDLLPNPKYSSIAATANAEARNVIMDCLETLPDRIEEANASLKIYSQKFDLRQEYKLKRVSAGLSIAILTTVEVMISWFEKPGYQKSFLSFVKQKEYPADIQDAVAKVNTRSEDLRRIADECQRKVTMNTNQRVTNMQDTTSSTYTAVKDLPEIIEAKIKNLMLEFLCARLSNADCTGWRIHSSPTAYVSNNSLRQFLNVKTELIKEAIDKALNQGQGNGPGASQLIQQLSRDPRFHSWLTTNQSGLLVLSRNSDDPSSVFSYFAAMLVASLRNYRPAIAIHFFCPIWDPENPPGSYYLLRSLIVQLLLFPNDLAITPQELPPLQHDPSQLRDLFIKLLASLPSGKTVFVVIDGIARHSADDEKETLFVVHLLRDVSRTHSENVRVKVLLTAPVPFEATDLLSDDSRLMLAVGTGDYRDFGQTHLSMLLGVPGQEPDR
ncbi:hypothetical protein FGG08_006269 [Glutinoglossum americanum]|uniref:Nephrocystin 3-like N-terminal domain-containing protein n=1 Tax=Glutinoglossum americanum TaxID=1670608 RepID=A0A9P8KXN3_9PEZI|nr:hypothetical protein FGG08_006269 [Glutinoglossum americanum]